MNEWTEALISGVTLVVLIVGIVALLYGVQ